MERGVYQKCLAAVPAADQRKNASVAGAVDYHFGLVGYGLFFHASRRRVYYFSLSAFGVDHDRPGDVAGVFLATVDHSSGRDANGSDSFNHDCSAERRSAPEQQSRKPGTHRANAGADADRASESR